MSLERSGPTTGTDRLLVIDGSMPRASKIRWIKKGWRKTKFPLPSFCMSTPRYLSMEPSSVNANSSGPFARLSMNALITTLDGDTRMQSSTYTRIIMSFLMKTQGSLCDSLNPQSSSPCFKHAYQLLDACFRPYKLFSRQRTYRLFW